MLCKFHVLEIRKKSSNDTGSTGKFEIPAKIIWKFHRLICCCASFNKSLVCCAGAELIKKSSNDNGYFKGHQGNLNFPTKFIIDFAKKIFCQMTLGISRQGSTEKFEFPAKIVEYCWKRKLTGLSNLLVGAQKRKKKKIVKWHWVFQGSTGNCHTCLKKPGLLHTMGEPRCPVTGYIYRSWGVNELHKPKNHAYFSSYLCSY